MHRWRGRLALPAALLATAAPPGAAAARAGQSVYERAPADPRAVTVAGVGDGRADDSAAIQRAIDAAAAKGGGGIVFLPQGRYRLTRTVYLWPGVRLFGVGRRRPVLVLADDTPGFASGIATMVMFAGAKRGEVAHVPFPPPGSVPADPQIADANSGTFYSALANVDFVIGRGNAGATAVRFHAAQHSYLAHVDFTLGSALAGVYQVGNEAEDLHFHGGRYGILAEKTSPAWQFTLLDSTFDGQRDAAIREHEAGLTLVNVAFRDTPVGIDIDKGYGDWLWGRDVRFQRVSRAGIVISNEANAYTQIGFDHAVAEATPVFARFRDSGRTVDAPAARYAVGTFAHGLMVPAMGEMGTTATRIDATPLAKMPPPPPAAIRALPPVAQWTNVRALGAVGDGEADDTAAIQRAIDAHRVVYFPAGHYRVTDTLRLKPESVLVALHPGLTQIVLPDGLPAFAGVGAPKALIESASGGDAVVSGLGLFTGGINPRATALLWMAGERSLVQDVKIQGGHGTDRADGTRVDPYNATHTADPDPARRWDGQGPSIWVTRGGGGTFSNVWSPSTYAAAGLRVSDTTTPGHVYQLSAEHHARTEIALDHVANWELLAPQTEEEAGESGGAASVTIQDSHNILLANYHGYRVTRSQMPAPAAIVLYGENDVRLRNVHVNAESGFATCDEGGCATYLRASKYPFADAVLDRTHGLAMREREFAGLDIRPHPATPVAATVDGARVTRLADGFAALGGGAVGSDGTLFFVDRRQQRIYRWGAAGGLAVVSDRPLDPVNLAVDRSGRLMVLSSAGRYGSVYSLDPKAADGDVRPIEPTTAGAHPGARLLLPVNWWSNAEFRDRYDPATDSFPTLAALFANDAATAQPRQYVSPDGSVALPAFRMFQQGPSSYLGWRFSHTLDATALVAAGVGERVLVSNESEDRVYAGTVAAGGAITGLTPLTQRGGESVVAAPDGRVFVANGQVFVYAADGTPQGRIDVPERPLQLLIGGADRRTLFVLCTHALYTVAL